MPVWPSSSSALRAMPPWRRHQRRLSIFWMRIASKYCDRGLGFFLGAIFTACGALRPTPSAHTARATPVSAVASPKTLFE
eukprot:2948114-Prymnesium_polylepis.1